MAYSKFIAYGTYIEIYQYQRSLMPSERPRRTHRRFSFGGVVSVGGFDQTKQIQARRKDNAGRARMAFLRLIKANLTRPSLPTMVTLTYREEVQELSRGYKDFRTFIKSLRYRFGKQFEYIAVPEFTKRGRVHFHVLFWGLSKLDIGTERTYPKNSYDCIYWLKGVGGFIFQKDTDGRERLAGYLAKYMSKAFLDPRMFQEKAYVSSRGITKPTVQGGNFDFSYFWDDVIGDKFPIQERRYDTKFLGKGRFRLFTLT